MVDRPRLRLLARQLVDTTLDFFIPPKCLQCHRAGSLLCANCRANLQSPPPLREPGSPITERRATAEFDGVIQQAIHAFKYQGQFRYGQPLSDLLFDELKRAGWPADLITATPLHEARLHSRGYNQSAVLAESLAKAAHIPFRPDVIRRVRDTRPQVGLNIRDRQQNVAGAFAADPALANGQRVVIIDDVYTTGITLRECAQALKQAGANTVWALTVACTKARETGAPF